MATTRSKLHPYFRPFFQTATTVPKLFIAAIFFVVMIIGHILLTAISDLVRDKGEEWLFGTTKVLVTNPDTRRYLDRGLLVATKHPTSTVLALFAILLLLIAIASAIQVWHATTHGAVAVQSPASERRELLDNKPSELKEIGHQKFKNQEVPLDGHMYLDCTFENVTFVYNNGLTGGFDQACRWTGSVGFVSREPRIQQLLGFLRSLHIIRIDAEGLLTPILNENLEPIGSSVAIRTPDDLAHYYARIVNLWDDVKDKEDVFRLLKEYVQGHWDDLVQNKKNPMDSWIARNSPADTLVEEDVKKIQEQMTDAAKGWRNALQALISLLHFNFDL